MVSLKCGVVSCMHNSDNYCCKGTILVEGREAETQSGTYCASFDENKSGSYRNHAETPQPNSVVNCEACNCIYNEKRVCRADSIGIAGTHAASSEETECASFRCRSDCGCK